MPQIICQRRLLAGLAATLWLCLLAASPARADDFYRGRNVNLYIGLGVGGTYDLYARTIARHLGRHIPGAPSVVPISMPGAGGLTAANYMYQVAPHDGTALAMTSQTLALDQLFKVSGVGYDAAKFIWIGRATSSPIIFFTWHTSPTRTYADAKRRVTTLGSSGSGDTTDTPRALDALGGAKFKLVLGYRGSTETMLAVERGEVEGGYAAWTDLKFRKADWLRDKMVNLLVLVADKPDPDYPNLPLSDTLVPAGEAQKIMTLFAAPNEIGRSLFTTPGVPADRVAMLRRALHATLADPAFLADAKKVGFEVDETSGAKLQEQVHALLQTPADLVAKADAARQP